MNKTAKEMWADAGFKFSYDYHDSIVFSDMDRGQGYHIRFGSSDVEINKDGSFKGSYNKSDGDEGSIEFTPLMMKALFQQIKEFGVE